jgi:hypothetical protein
VRWWWLDARGERDIGGEDEAGGKVDGYVNAVEGAKERLECKSASSAMVGERNASQDQRSKAQGLWAMDASLVPGVPASAHLTARRNL